MGGWAFFLGLAVLFVFAARTLENGAREDVVGGEVDNVGVDEVSCLGKVKHYYIIEIAMAMMDIMNNEELNKD